MFKSSVVSYDSRGPWGNYKYRGNTSGKIVHDFLDFCEMKMGKINSCSDYMSGSFTTRDVCMERGITGGSFLDLSMGFNLLLNDIPDRPETIFFHPPYSELINIPYAGSMWDDKEFERKYGYDPKPYDLGRMPWEEFIRALNYCVMKQYSSLTKGGRMGILMGDIRKNKLYKSMLLDICKPGQLESIVIKCQRNTMSENRTYSNKNFIPIEQEYFLILKKLSSYILDFSYTIREKLDIRDSKAVTWKDVVLSVLEEKGPCEVKQLYDEIKDYAKAKNCSFYKEKIRQELQLLQKKGLTVNVSRGVWKAA